MAKEIITIEDLTVTLYHKNIKNMYLRVIPPDGEIKVSAPLFVSDTEIINFIKSRKKWILEKQSLILENKIKTPLKYKNGETHHVWGNPYKLQLIKNNTIKTVLIDEENSILYLPIPKRSTIEKRKNILDEFYREELKKSIPPILDKMKNWGNCKQDGRITLNLNLAKKDIECLEYVMIHELCHLIEFNHGKKFKKLMDKFCPNWKEIKKRLNE